MRVCKASLEVVPGVRRWSSGSRGRGAAAGRILHCRRLPEPSPFLTQPNPVQSQPPTPVPAVDPGVTMSPAVFLSLPDLRCSLLLLVSKGMTDPSADIRMACRPRRGGHSCRYPCFPIFSPGGEECTLPRCLHSRHPSVSFPGPGFPRPEKLRSEVGPINRRLALGEGSVGGSRRAAPLPLEFGGCFSPVGSRTLR